MSDNDCHFVLMKNLYTEDDSQVMFVRSNFPLHKLISPSLAIIGKVEQMNQIRFFFQNSLPTKIHYIFQSESLFRTVIGRKVDY